MIPAGYCLKIAMPLAVPALLAIAVYALFPSWQLHQLRYGMRLCTFARI